MHDYLRPTLTLLTALSRPLAEDASASQIKVALVTGVFLLAGTLITVFGQRRDRSSPADAMEARNAQRNYDRQVTRAERAEHRCEVLGQEVTRLRELVRALGHDPDEDPDNVRSPA